jgi:MFS family permease
VDAAAAMFRNVRLYPWYALTSNAYFWMPVFVLYFLEHMSLADVLRLEAIYYIAVVVLEVPSGYFSDRVGRRPTLLISCVAHIAACALFFFGASFGIFAIAQCLLAAGIAFNSGTDTSLHFDSLASVERQSEYDDREAIAARNALVSAGVSGLVGGAVAILDLRYAYALTGVAALASLGIVLRMSEPPVHGRLLIRNGLLRQIRECAGCLGEPVLRWTFAYAVVMTVLNHVPYEFYQPYIEGVLPAGLARATPFTSGVHVLLVMLIAAALAARSIRIRDRFGYGPTLLFAALLQVGIILSMGAGQHIIVVMLLLARSVPRALAAAPTNAAIAPRVPTTLRATYLSMQSLAGRLAFGLSLLGLALVGESEAATTWSAMSTKLLVAGGAGAIAWFGLSVARPRDRSI